MKVSRRVPVHGEFGGSGFKEQRYVRGAAPWLSALLFGVLERAALSPRLQAGLQALLQGADSPMERVLEIAGNCRVADDDKLIAWEVWGEAFLHFFRQKHPGADDFSIIGYLQQTLAVQTLQWNEAEAEGYFHLHWGQTSDGTVVLLYRKPTFDSYAVVPECRHICEKYDLFRQAREALEAKAASRTEFSQYFISCGGCSTNINQFVFDLAESAGPRMELVHHTVLRELAVSALERDCAACRQGKSLCVDESCRCCVECAMISAVSDLGLKCPNCKNRLIWEKVKKEASEKDARWINCESWITLNCDTCHLEKPITEISAGRNQQAPWICNQCSHSVSQSLEPECVYIIGVQRQLLENDKKPECSDPLAESDKQICDYCKEPREISSFKTYLRESHRCFLCDVCVEIIFGKCHEQKCSLCSNLLSLDDIQQFLRDISGSEVTDIRCESCLQIKTMGDYAQSSKLSHWWRRKICDSCLPSSMSEIEGPKQIEETTSCELCLERKPESEFHSRTPEHHCLICERCYQVKVSSLQRCPLCKSSHKVENLPDKNTCLMCFDCFDSSTFLTSCKLNHPCVLCDNCMPKCKKEGKCMKCHSSYNSRDLGILQDIRPIQQPLADTCACGRPTVGGKLFCLQKCCCSFCLFTHIVITGDRLCPKCHLRIEGFTLWSVKCSDCLEAVAINRSEPKVLTGLCENGCILCRRCVIIEGARLVCPMCRAAVQGEDAQIVQQEQKQCLLACRCVGAHGVLKPAGCKHDLHQSCVYVTYSCRICREQLRPRPETINISQFA